MVSTFRLQPQLVRGRLLPRQVCSLVVSQMGGQVLSLLYIGFQLTGPTRRTSIDNFCLVWSSGFFTLRYVAAFQEIHIAVVFMCQANRSMRVLGWLARGIPAVWVAGVVTGLFDTSVDPWGFSDEPGDVCAPKQETRLPVWVLSFCSAICGVAYGAALYKSSKYGPASVSRRAWLRAARYPAIQLSTMALILIAYIHRPLMSVQWYFGLAVTAEMSAGLWNVLAYAHQRGLWSGSTTLDTLSPSGRGRARDVSFHAGFADAVEIQCVAPINREANAQTERDITKLQLTRGEHIGNSRFVQPFPIRGRPLSMGSGSVCKTPYVIRGWDSCATLDAELE